MSNHHEMFFPSFDRLSDLTFLFSPEHNNISTPKPDTRDPATKALMRKDSHREVEKRRRQAMSDAIAALASLLPQQYKTKSNAQKSKVLQNTKEHILILQSQILQLQSQNQLLQNQIVELENQVKELDPQHLRNVEQELETCKKEREMEKEIYENVIRDLSMQLKNTREE